jgi:hypothetical protein
MTKNLFPEDRRDTFDWHAYLSSALTIPDALIRDRVLKLNSLIKGWLEDATNTFMYLPQEYSDPSRGDKMKPEEIYILDRWRIAESDYVIMALDTPAFGVGQEAEIACSMGIPIIAFHYKGNSVSRIIKGIPAIFTGEGTSQPSDGVIAYEDQHNYEDLKGKLIATVKMVQKSVKRLPADTSTATTFSERLNRAIKNSGKSIPQLAKETGFTEAFLNSLLNSYQHIQSIFEPYEILKLCRMRSIPEERYLNPGLWVLRKLSETLKIRISSLIGDEDVGRAWHEPLLSLSKKGVTLEEFVEVSEDADYLIMYREAARAGSSEEVAQSIFKLVERKRNERPQ